MPRSYTKKIFSHKRRTTRVPQINTRKTLKSRANFQERQIKKRARQLARLYHEEHGDEIDDEHIQNFIGIHFPEIPENNIQQILDNLHGENNNNDPDPNSNIPALKVNWSRPKQAILALIVYLIWFSLNLPGTNMNNAEGSHKFTYSSRAKTNND